LHFAFFTLGLVMYTTFYNLREKPFEITPDPRFLYLSENHKEGLAHLVYAVKEKRGFTVITGEVGTGKTTLIQTLLSRLDGSTRTAYLFHPKLGPTDFLQYICEDFGLKSSGRSKGQCLSLLQKFLMGCYARNENVVLIIDEAQGLDPHLLEEVRLLTNLETAKNKLLQVILVGQPELSRLLDQSQCRQLKQRVSLRYHIKPLNKEEAKVYIKQRLKRAGAIDTNIFTPRAIETIYRYTQGIPRSINIICDNALLSGYGADQKVIGHEIVREVAKNLEGPGTQKERRRKRFLGMILFVILLLGVLGLLWRFGAPEGAELELARWVETIREAVGKVLR